MPERSGPELGGAEELEKEAVIRRAEEYSPEIRELSALLEVARRWALSTSANGAHEAVYKAAEARGYAVLGADRDLRGLLDAQRSG